MCNCINDVLEKVKQQAEDYSANGEKVESIEFEHRSHYPITALYSNVIAKTTFIKKDGNRSKPINNHVSIFYTFCPFCGQKYQKFPKSHLVSSETTNIKPNSNEKRGKAGA